jgi:hypothetical protein
MQSNPNRKKMAAFSLVRARSDNSGGHDDYHLRKELGEACMALFDRWCERRELTPLIYLLHAWPFFPSTAQPIKNVSATLDDLLKFHREALDVGDREMIARILALAGY